MELLKNMLVDWMLFSLIEGVIYSLFFYKICALKKMSVNQILLMSLGNCLISTSGIFPPIVYQICMIIFMGIILSGINEIDIKLGIKYSVYVMIFQLVTEVLFTMSLDFFSSISLLENSNKMEVFNYLLPVRMIQILIIIIGGSQMKGWVGQITKPVRK